MVLWVRTCEPLTRFAWVFVVCLGHPSWTRKQSWIWGSRDSCSLICESLVGFLFDFVMNQSLAGLLLWLIQRLCFGQWESCQKMKMCGSYQIRTLRSLFQPSKEDCMQAPSNGSSVDGWAAWRNPWKSQHLWDSLFWRLWVWLCLDASTFLQAEEIKLTSKKLRYSMKAWMIYICV